MREKHKKLKILLNAIKHKKFFRTKYLKIDYKPHEIKNQISFLLKNGYISNHSLHYYQRNFEKEEIKNILKNY